MATPTIDLAVFRANFPYFADPLQYSDDFILFRWKMVVQAYSILSQYTDLDTQTYYFYCALAHHMVLDTDTGRGVNRGVGSAQTIHTGTVTTTYLHYARRESKQYYYSTNYGATLYDAMEPLVGFTVF